jgi:predicted nucleotidyltransferase
LLTFVVFNNKPLKENEMKTLEEIKSVLARNKSRFSQKYGETELAVFGSYSRNDQTENSDIDILVDFEKPVGLEFIELAIELENLLELKVDLVSKNGIKPRYFESVKEELIYV